MRSVVLLLFFAASFGIAGLWQAHRLRVLREERELELRVQDGEIGRTPSGLLERGHAVVVIGRPSGAEPLATAPADPPQEPPAPAAQPAQRLAPPLNDFELVVQPGQTLSGIARSHYGTAAPDVVGALAAYNHLKSPDALKTGTKLELPPRERLPRR